MSALLERYELTEAAFVGSGSNARLRLSGRRAEQVRRETLSPSSANSLKRCPAGWASDYFFRAEQFEDALGASTIGSDAHWVLEQFYALAPSERLLGAMLRYIAERVSMFTYVGEGTAAIAGELITRAAMGIWLIERPAEIALATYEKAETVVIDGKEAVKYVTVPAIEQEYRATIGGVKVRGLVDSQTLNDDGSINLRDFKSGKQPTREAYGEDNRKQQRIYALAIEQVRGALPKTVQLLYTNCFTDAALEAAYLVAEGKLSLEEALALKPEWEIWPKAKSVPFNAELFAEVKVHLQESWKIHQTCCDRREFPVGERSTLCKFCPLQVSCPVGSTLS
jgi:RecB family exonuclease